MKLYELGSIILVIVIILIVGSAIFRGNKENRKGYSDLEYRYEELEEENEMLLEVIRNAKNYIEAEEYDDAHYVLDALDPRW